MRQAGRAAAASCSALRMQGSTHGMFSCLHVRLSHNGDCGVLARAHPMQQLPPKGLLGLKGGLR